MKSKTMAETMTTTRRLTILDREVCKSVRHVLTAVDCLLQVIENLLLAKEHAPVDSVVGEQAAHRLAIDDVGLLFELAQHATRVDELRIRVLAKVRQRVLQHQGSCHELVDQHVHRQARGSY